MIDPDHLLSADERPRVKTYINALHYSDALFADLIAHFSTRKEKTLIVMLGDHQPFLEGYRQKAWQRMVEKYRDNEVTKVLANYWVPVALWSNYERPEEKFEYSMNFLPSYLIEQLGLIPSGFYKLNRILRDKIGVLSWVVKDPDGGYSFPIPFKYRPLARDYELIQYDILNGEDYFGQLMNDERIKE